MIVLLRATFRLDGKNCLSGFSPVKSLKKQKIFTTDTSVWLPPRVFNVQGQFNFSSNKAKSFDILLDYSVDGAEVLCQYITLSLNMSVFLKKIKGDECFIFNQR